MFVEFCDQVAGNSTPSWRKEPTAAVRDSHSTVSNGCTPGWVKRRWMRIASPETTPSVVRGDCVGGVMLLLQDTGVCRSNGGAGCARRAAENAHIAGLFRASRAGPRDRAPGGSTTGRRMLARGSDGTGAHGAVSPQRNPHLPRTRSQRADGTLGAVQPAISALSRRSSRSSRPRCWSSICSADWRAARVNVGGVVVVQSGTAGWNGVGALAGLAAIVVVAAELAHLAGRRDRPLLVLGASLIALVASVGAAVSTTSSGVEVDSQVTVEPDVVLWAARTGIARRGHRRRGGDDRPRAHTARS